MENKYVCASCGLECSHENGPCKDCGGYRIVSIEFVEHIFGSTWRDSFVKTDPAVRPDGGAMKHKPTVAFIGVDACQEIVRQAEERGRNEK